MFKKLIVNRGDGQSIEATMCLLDLSYIDQIMELQDEILEGLEDKQLYAPTEREEFVDYINHGASILGVLTPENELFAMGVYASKGYDEGNYGYDIGIKGKELLKVGQIESTVVKKEYRGNGLQKLICQELEIIAKENQNTLLTSTASPYNKFSVNTFLNLGYKINLEKVKYGGLKRYVMSKPIGYN